MEQSNHLNMQNGTATKGCESVLKLQGVNEQK